VLENRAIPLLEAKANEALAKLGGKTASARIELRTQREKKDGAGLVEALDIVVCTAEGYERRYESWSGGEQMRLDVAIRLGLLALSGAEMGILILDEPGNLDESGKADLIALLDSVLALGIERVLLVSHDPDLREAFDQVIEIEVTPDGGSRILGAVGAEAVVA
jgi:exonuclease SbcC